MIKLKRSSCAVLPLVLERVWFEKIESGEKYEEYRCGSRMMRMIQRRRIEAVLNIHIDSRWQYAKLWTPQERRIAMEIDRARRSAWAGGVQ